MQLNGRQRQLLCDVCVLQLASLIDGLALHPLGGQRAGRNGRTTAECFELGVDDFAVFVNLDLQLHDVATSWCSDQTGSDRHVLLVQRANIPRIFVVLQHLRKQTKIETYIAKKHTCKSIRIRRSIQMKNAKNKITNTYVSVIKSDWNTLGSLQSKEATGNSR